VTVTTLGPNAKRGVVGAGTIDAKHWRVVVNRSLGGECTPQLYQLTCGFAYQGGSVGPRQVSLNSFSAGGTQYQFGTVGANVSHVAIQLSNGTVLSVQPVSAGGKRWVAVAAPLRTIARAMSYVGQSEYEHAIPFVDTNGTAEFITWLRPGQTGLPVASRSVGSGQFDGVPWQAAVHTGPWGYCATFANGSDCFQAISASKLLAGRTVDPLTCGPLYTSSGKATGASSGVAAVPSDVKDVVLQFADGSRLRITTFAIGGIRTLGFAIPGRPKVVRALEYGVHGQLLHSASGAGWGC
jgi:hypothetical protein